MLSTNEERSELVPKAGDTAGVQSDIAEQKKLIRRLEENENTLHSLFDCADIMLSVISEDGIILDVNQSLITHLGYSREELIGRGIRELHPLRCQQKAILVLPGEEKSKSYPIPLITKDGRYLQAESYIVRGVWNGRQVLFCVSRDNSAVKVLEEKFQKVFQSNSTLMAISVLESGCFVDVNEQFCKTLGYLREEVIGKTSTELNLFVDPEQRNEIKKKVLEFGHVDYANVSVRKKNGEIRYGLFSAHRLYLQNGVFLLTDMNDITERKLAEDALKEMNNWLELEVQRRTTDLHNATLKMSDEIALRRKAEESLRYRLSIEIAVAQSSKLFLTSDTVDINEVLGILGSAVSANRAYVFDYNHDLTKVSNTYEWCDGFTEPQKDNLQNVETSIFPWWTEKLTRYETIMITDVEQMPPDAKEAQDIFREQSIKSLLVVPMVWSSGKLAGFMGFDDTCRCRLWSQEDINALNVMAKMTVLYWEQKNAKNESALHQEQLTALSSRLIKMREQERKLISREIHDELGTVLTVLKFDLSWVGKRIQNAGGEIQSKIESMSKTIDDTIKMVQKICTELRPALIDNMGLVAAIEWHIAEFEKRTGIQCELDLPESFMLEPNYSIEIFRIFQELLTNVARHSRAGKVKVQLSYDGSILKMVIADNGCGIDAVQIRASESLGLIGIRERIKYLKGHFDIAGTSGGTTATVCIPFTGKGKK